MFRLRLEACKKSSDVEISEGSGEEREICFIIRKFERPEKRKILYQKSPTQKPRSLFYRTENKKTKNF